MTFSEPSRRALVGAIDGDAARFACWNAPPRTPLEVTLGVLDGGFRLLIVWQLFWGARPFSELMRNVPGINKKTLRQELTNMDRAGLLHRELRPGAHRRADYALTPLGQSLKPLVAAMYEWGLARLQARGPKRGSLSGAGSPS